MKTRLAWLALVLSFLTSSSLAQQPPQPAPVPPEVTIPRPTAAEIEQVEQSLKKFLDTADSSTKDIVSRFPELVAVHPPRANSAIVPSLFQNFRGKHRANVRRAKEGDID